ncbi:Abnormal spindle-like microcephaly-associated [Sphaceloma murrayae]|uniref:Abnormal spindle-like microcephaly-associated n=1 Tax=Sphaceloma murrayae TaxID=2082308 RepID=A0A2K1QJP3_9PEZI|nr:Abnormal spindle-like microcephaly-associated [Sphaceloma murrayae]
MASHSIALPSRPEHAAQPKYSIQSFDTNLAASSYISYSDPITEHGYASSNLASSPGKSAAPAESFGYRVFNTLSDAVKKTPTTIPNLSRTSSVHTRTRSLADSPGAMLARTTSIRLGGLLNRTPTQKASRPVQDQDEDLSEPEDMPEYKTTFSGTPDQSTRANTPRQSTPSRPSTAQQQRPRFSWFSTPKAEPSTPTHTSHHTTTTSALELSDPLLALNINASLFPHGPSDPHDPASFNDLLLSASALADRLQTAYRAQAALLRQAQAERDAAAEEKDEAATRAAHLKSQLETLAQTFGEQTRTMRDMDEELRRERERRVEMEAELDSLRRWKGQAEEGGRDSVLSGDEETPRRRRKRGSEGLNSDSGFESDSESLTCSMETASTFSGPVTPGMGGITGVMEGPWEEGRKNTPGVWGVVGDLQRENYRLKTRVRDLEGAVEGCLSLVR